MRYGIVWPVFRIRLIQLGLICIFPVVIAGMLITIYSMEQYFWLGVLILVANAVMLSLAAYTIANLNDDIEGE